MMRFALTLAAGFLMSAALAADAIESGLKSGERIWAFDVVDVTGPDKGTQLCLV